MFINIKRYCLNKPQKKESRDENPTTLLFCCKINYEKNSQQGNNTLNQTTYQLMLPLELELKIETSEVVRLMLDNHRKVGL